MKKTLIALSLFAFATAFAVTVSAPLIGSEAAAYHDSCKKGYYYDEDKKRCVRKRRGSHG